MEKKNNELTEDQVQELMNKIVQLKQLPDLVVDLMGSWLWVSGETKKNKEELKKLGCRWSKSKGSWYWHLDIDTHRWYRGRRTLIEIEAKYGKQTL